MINKFKRIVVPTDYSDTAQSAVNAGAELAAYYRAQLDLVNSVDATVYAYAGYPFASLSKELVASAEEAINRVKLFRSIATSCPETQPLKSWRTSSALKPTLWSWAHTGMAPSRAFCWAVWLTACCTRHPARPS
jgi:hypothetical protein